MTPCTAACQASLSRGFSRQEHWSRLPFPSPGDLSDAEIKPMSPVLAGGFLVLDHQGNPFCVCVCTHHIFISSSVNGYLGCFHIFAIVNSSAMNAEVCHGPGTEYFRQELIY